MKQATKDYLSQLETEVSSKTTLRNLQYRLNRMNEEKKEANLRLELETQKMIKKMNTIDSKKQHKKLNVNKSTKELPTFKYQTESA